MIVLMPLLVVAVIAATPAPDPAAGAVPIKGPAAVRLPETAPSGARRPPVPSSWR